MLSNQDPLNRRRGQMRIIIDICFIEEVAVDDVIYRKPVYVSGRTPVYDVTKGKPLLVFISLVTICFCHPAICSKDAKETLFSTPF